MGRFKFILSREDGEGIWRPQGTAGNPCSAVSPAIAARSFAAAGGSG
jgi:hypothetical protein